MIISNTWLHNRTNAGVKTVVQTKQVSKKSETWHSEWSERSSEGGWNEPSLGGKEMESRVVDYGSHGKLVIVETVDCG